MRHKQKKETSFWTQLNKQTDTTFYFWTSLCMRFVSKQCHTQHVFEKPNKSPVKIFHKISPGFRFMHPQSWFLRVCTSCSERWLHSPSLSLIFFSPLHFSAFKSRSSLIEFSSSHILRRRENPSLWTKTHHLIPKQRNTQQIHQRTFLCRPLFLN